MIIIILLISFYKLCTPRVTASNADEFYKAVCRSWAVESIDLKMFLQKIRPSDSRMLHKETDTRKPPNELDKLEFTDWVCFTLFFYDKSLHLRLKNYSI